MNDFVTRGLVCLVVVTLALGGSALAAPNGTPTPTGNPAPTNSSTPTSDPQSQQTDSGKGTFWRIKDGLQDTADTVTGDLGTGVGQVTDGVGDTIGNTVDGVQTTYTNFKDGVGNMVNSATKGYRNAMQTILGPFLTGHLHIERQQCIHIPIRHISRYSRQACFPGHWNRDADQVADLLTNRV